MKSFAKLVKNELIKIFAQTAYKVLFIIMIALFILVPLLSKGLDWLINTVNTYETSESSIEFYEEEVKNSKDPLEKAYAQINLDVYKYFEKCKLDSNSWQFKTMYQDYLDYSMSEYIFGKLYLGEVSLEEVKNSSFAYYLENAKITGTEVDKETLKLFFEESSKQKSEYEKLIKESEISDLYQKYYDDLTKNINDYKQFISLLRVEKIQKDDVMIDYQIMVLEQSIIVCENSKEIFSLAIKNEFEFDSWEYNSALATFKIAYETSITQLPLSEEEFLKSDSVDKFKNYEDYIEEWKESLLERVDAVKALKFSVENDIPTQAMQKSSAKGVFLTTVTSNIQYVIYFVVVLSALIVANEFSSGSARLLFIRPHSRNKILMSKLSAILILIIALNVINILLSFVFTLIFNGIGDIFVSNIKIVDGVAEKSGMIWQLLGTVILANFRLIFIVVLTFMISTLLKKGALGIILGIVADSVFSTVAGVISAASSANVIKFIPLSYYVGEIFAINKVEGILLNYTQNINVSSMVNSIYYAYASNLSIWGAIGNFAFWTTICIAITFLIFKKQEIKN